MVQPEDRPPVLAEVRAAAAPLPVPLGHGHTPAAGIAEGPWMGAGALVFALPWLAMAGGRRTSGGLELPGLKSQLHMVPSPPAQKGHSGGGALPCAHAHKW